jgi:hypothetical protein
MKTKSRLILKNMEHHKWVVIETIFMKVIAAFKYKKDGLKCIKENEIKYKNLFNAHRIGIYIK